MTDDRTCLCDHSRVLEHPFGGSCTTPGCGCLRYRAREVDEPKLDEKVESESVWVEFDVAEYEELKGLAASRDWSLAQLIRYYVRRGMSEEQR